MATTSMTPAITPAFDLNSARMLSSGNMAPATGSTEAKLKQAAQGFERTLIRQMLSTARKADMSGGDDSSTSKSYLEIMDDHLADLMSQGKGMGFGSKMAEQLIQQANVAKLSGNEQIAVKPLNAPREAVVSAETLQSLQRPDGFLGLPK